MFQRQPVSMASSAVRDVTVARRGDEDPGSSMFFVSAPFRWKGLAAAASGARVAGSPALPVGLPSATWNL